eukprot:jgi/Galph1/2192/GphlegSOOS_G854.1
MTSVWDKPISDKVQPIFSTIKGLEKFLDGWKQYVYQLQVEVNTQPKETIPKDVIYLQQEINYLKETNASLEKSLQCHEEEFSQLSEYTCQLEQLCYSQENKNLNAKVNPMPSEQMTAIFRNLRQQKRIVEINKQKLAALREHYTKSLQDIHSYLFQQLCQLLEYFSSNDLEELRKENRYLRRCIQEWKGNLRVVVRVRPLLYDVQQSVLSFIGDDMITCQGSESQRLMFTFDQVFSPHASSEDLLQEVQTMIASMFDGFHACILAYGPTGSGKTYTVFGPDGKSGVMELAIRELFSWIERENDMDIVPTLNMLEIYNENVRDLLSQDPLVNLELREDSNSGEIFAQGATEVELTNYYDALTMIQSGLELRSTSATMLNISSSRSHLICILRLLMKESNRNLGILYITDLAGCERVGRSQVQNERLDETKHINRSLSCLVDVFAALRTQQTHVPYRNSRLTFLLRPALSKYGKAMMVVHVSPEKTELQETIQTLRLGQRARGIELRPTTSQGNNTNDSCNMFLRRQVSLLRRQLEEEKRKNSVAK